MSSNPVAQKLQSMILRGNFKAGEALPGQRALAGSLGISRPALREALSTLEALGLVEIRQARGVYVRNPHGADDAAHPARRLRQIFEFRLALEPFVAFLASQRSTANDLEELATCNARMRAALEEGNLIEAMEADLSFHRSLLAMSGNPIFIGVAGQLANDMAFATSYPLRRRETLMEPIEEHGAILAAIREGSGKAARDAMLVHLHATKQRSGVAHDD